MSVHLFGIRHHGPGCARALRAALETLAPDVLVLEAPADVEPVLPLIAHEQMQPPVALLIYPPDEPKRAVYYPLAVYSPEWQALRYAQARSIPVRLMDLPQRHRLALDMAEQQQAAANTAADNPAADDNGSDEPPTPNADESLAEAPDAEQLRSDPLALLAEAAGYRDHELWWEEQVERRRDAQGLFDAIFEAMRSVREHAPPVRDRDLLREAHMRSTLRAVVKEGFQRVAVVCGAYHVPVLDEAALAGRTDGCGNKDDAARLKGLPKIKTEATWIPWTYARLTYRSGYGAGVYSPGWYAHLWESGEQAATRWVASAARLLREADLDASSASVIEVVRLADTLAAMREIRAPGLTELNEAMLTVLCHGQPAPLTLIRNRLEIGDVLGCVPTDAPTVPLARDLEQQQKSLRLKLSTEIKVLDLDLRSTNDLARSHLLHRLRLLEIEWGTLEQSGGRTSTFHEIWRVRWQPEFAVALIEANGWGNSVAAAAANKVIRQAHDAQELPPITELLDASILAGLDATIDPLLDRIQEVSAAAGDVRQLLEALLPLARVVRYGDVRGTQAAHLLPVLVGLFQRACVGLPAACAALDDDAAERMLHSIGQAQQALDVLDQSELLSEWQPRLAHLMHGNAHGLLRGWCCRLLLEKQVIDGEQLHRLTRLALSTASDAQQAAAWIAGLLRGSGLVVLHQDGLWRVLDQWLRELSAEAFTELLPLVRRAFSDFAPAERRQMGTKVQHLSASDSDAQSPRRPETTGNVDHQRAASVLPVLAHILAGTP